MTRKQKGFTLIELLIVVAIIGILAAIAIPNLLTAMHRSRQKRTMADMRNIATAWEARATDTNDYSAAGLSWPATGQTVGAFGLQGKLEPTYIKKMPTVDGWGHELYAGTADSGQSYALRSQGKDGTDDAAGAGSNGPVTTTDFDCDIIFCDGNFCMYPEGVQGQ
jgi:type II secretion system protein G